MKISIIAVTLLSGCTVVSNNRVFPKLSLYWSADAKEQRRERAAEEWNGKQYRACLANLNQQLTLRRIQVVDLAEVGRNLVSKYGSALTVNTILGEWQSGATNVYSQSLACDVMWIQNQTPREQDLSWLMCFQSEWSK